MYVNHVKESKTKPWWYSCNSFVAWRRYGAMPSETYMSIEVNQAIEGVLSTNGVYAMYSIIDSIKTLATL